MCLPFSSRDRARSVFVPASPHVLAPAHRPSLESPARLGAGHGQPGVPRAGGLQGPAGIPSVGSFSAERASLSLSDLEALSQGQLSAAANMASKHGGGGGGGSRATRGVCRAPRLPFPLSRPLRPRAASPGQRQPRAQPGPPFPKGML